MRLSVVTPLSFDSLCRQCLNSRQSAFNWHHVSCGDLTALWWTGSHLVAQVLRFLMCSEVIGSRSHN